MRIQEILRGRSDLSTFLVHFTRDMEGVSGKDRLKSILSDHRIKASKPMGHAVKALGDHGLSSDSQKCVSFTETPLEFAYLLIGEIEGRDCQFSPYGIAVPKRMGRNAGVNPVWYVDITPGHDWPSNYINNLINHAIASGSFEDSDITRIAPLIEQMGSNPGGYRKEFWWEREWRHIGDFLVPVRAIVLCPEAEIGEFKEFVDSLDIAVHWAFIDPNWTLEQIIARLAGFRPEEVDVF